MSWKGQAYIAPIERKHIVTKVGGLIHPSQSNIYLILFIEPGPHCFSVVVLVLAKVEYWMDNWTVADVTGLAGVIGQYLANAIISDKSKCR